MRRAAALLLALAALPAVAAPQVKLYPVRGLFMPAPEASLVDPAFPEAVPAASAGAYFQAEFRKAFPAAVDKVADKDRRFTLVVSLQLARASEYAVQKVDGTADILVPVSGSLYFTNAVSGEVLYTTAATFYARASVPGTDVEPDRLRSMYADAYRGLVAELLARAQAQFKPRTLGATVRREWNGLFVLDRGQDGGIAKGDTLADAQGNTVEVVYAAPGYAVASMVLGKVATGSALERETNADVGQVRRPRVMVLVDAVQAPVPREVVGQLFSDQLGAKAALSVVHVNPMFANVLATAFASTGLSNDNASKRELPDYFLRLGVPESISFELDTSARGLSVRSYRTVATAELVDRAGRVLFAASGQDRSEDEVVDGMGLDRHSRREVSLKNALLDLAQNIGTHLKFAHAELPLQAGAAPVAMDRDGLLAVGDQLFLFKSIGRVDGIAGEVRVPYVDANVDQLDGAGARLALGLPLTWTTQAPAPGDLVLVDVAAGARGATRRRFASCGPAEQLGSIALSGFGELALNVLERQFRAPFYSSAALEQVQRLVAPGARFRSRVPLTAPASDYCVETAYRVDPGPTQCGGDPRTCQDSATTRITYRIKRGAEVVARSGLETRVNGAGYLEGAPESDRRRLLEGDVLDASAKLARDIATTLNTQKLN